MPDLDIRFFQSDVENMLPELRKHKLAFTIGHEHFSSDEDSVYALVHEHLVEHLALHDLALPSDPRASSDTGTDLLDGPRSLSFHNLPWTVLLKSRILQQKDVKFYYKSDLNGYDVNLRLLKGSQMIKHPEDKNHLLLFIGACSYHRLVTLSSCSDQLLALATCVFGFACSILLQGAHAMTSSTSVHLFVS